MLVFVISFIVMLICVLGMSLGVLYGRPPIKGSCGNLSHLPGMDGEHTNCCGRCETKKHDASKSSVPPPSDFGRRSF
jgi:hypothetical protein